MKILVAVKRVIDYTVRVRVKSDGSGVETENIKMSMNPFDEIALEEAMRFKEKGWAEKVIAVSIGSKQSQDVLRTALAFGADEALLIETDEALEPRNIALILKATIEKYQFDLAILGKQAIDDDSNQTGQMLSAFLDWPQATFASKITLTGKQATVERETDQGIETLELTLPAVFTTDLRLNTPRYISLPNIMKAKSKPLTVLPLQDLNLNLQTQIETTEVAFPPSRKTGVLVENVDELLHKLKNEAKVLP